MDYTPNIDAQGMRRPMGPVDQPNWNGGPKLIHNPQVMNNQTVGQPNLANAMANQRPIIPIRGRIVTSEQDIVPAEIPMDGSICLFMTEDCKKVIAKQWNSNGVLQSIIYSISSNEQAQSECQNGDNTGSVKMRANGIYEASFAGNISGAVAGTPVQLAFQLGGATMPETTMVATPGAANASNNVATSTLIKNCCGDYDRITVTNTGTTDVTVAANSAFIVRRLA